jgi:Fe2+ or Zn2+ uptake regulation protein
MSDYSMLLKAVGLKATLQRIGMLEVIENAGHISIDDIYSKIHQMWPTLSLATIYKNILIMVDKGVLKEVPIAGAKSQYELAQSDHIHLICQKCGNIEDKIMDDLLKERLTAIAQHDSLILKQSHVDLYGLCKNCQ